MENTRDLENPELLTIIMKAKVKGPKQEDFMNRVQLAHEINDQQLSGLWRSDGPKTDHSLRVAANCCLFGVKDPELILSALLHDCLKKNTSCDCELLENAFGFKVVGYLEHLKNPGFSQFEKQDDRHRHYLNHLKYLIERCPHLGVLGLANFYDNISGLSTISDPDLQQKYCQRYEPLFEVYKNIVLRDNGRMMPIKAADQVLLELQLKQRLVKEITKKTS